MASFIQLLRSCGDVGGGIYYHRFHRWLSTFNSYGVVRMWEVFHYSTCRYYWGGAYNPVFWYLLAVLCLFFILPLASAGGLKKALFRFPDFSHMLCVFVVSNAVKSIDVDRLRANCFLISS